MKEANEIYKEEAVGKITVCKSVLSKQNSLAFKKLEQILGSFNPLGLLYFFPKL